MKLSAKAEWLLKKSREAAAWAQVPAFQVSSCVALTGVSLSLTSSRVTALRALRRV